MSSRVFSVLLAGFCVVYPFLFLTTGIDPTDSFFSIVQYNLVFEEPQKTSPMLWFSILLGGIWGKIAGGTLLSYRLLGALLMLATAVTAWWSLRRRVPPVLLLVCIAAVEMLLRTATTVGDYDGFSTLFLMMSLVLFFRWTDSPGSWVSLWGAGLLLGLAVFCKITALAWTVPLAAGLVYVLSRRPLSWWRPLGTALLGVLTACGAGLGFLAFEGRLEWYLEGSFFVTEMGGGQTSHGFVRILNKLTSEYVRALVPTALLIVGWFVSTLALGWGRRGSRLFAGLFFVVVFVSSILLVLWSPITPRGGMVVLVAVLTLCSLTVFVLALFDLREPDEIRTLSLVFLLGLLVGPVGTNVGVIYNAHFFWLSLPVAALLLFRRISQGSQKQLRLAGRSISMRFGPVPAAAFGFALLALTCVVAFTFVRRDAPRETLVAPVALPSMKGVLTSTTRAKLLEQLAADLRAVPARELISYGALPIAHTLSGLPPALTTSWPDLDSFSPQRFAQQLDQLALEGRWPAVLLAVTNPREELWSSQARLVDFTRDEKHHRLQRFVSDHGYRLIAQRRDYQLYIPEAP